MKYILSYDNGEDWEDYWRYHFLIDGDSIESIRQKVVDAFAEAVGTGHFDMIVDGYLYPMPTLKCGHHIDDELDFSVITVEDYLRKHMPEKA
jgi:hypothetical protein